MKKFWIGSAFGLLVLAAYKGKQLLNKKNALPQIKVSAQLPKFQNLKFDNGNLILQTTIALVFTNKTTYDYGIRAVYLHFTQKGSRIATIEGNKPINIVKSTDTAQVFDLLINLGNSFNQIQNIINNKEVIIDVTGVAKYGIIDIPIFTNFDLKPLLEAQAKELMAAAFKSLF